MTVYDKGWITVVGCAVAFAALAIPLILRKVPRNVVYGFRTRATLANDAVWYEANAHFGRGLLIGSIVSAIAITILRRATDLSPRQFFAGSVAALAAPVAIATLATARRVLSMTRNDADQERKSR